MELVDAMRSQHACRYYRSDPVPNEVFYDAIDAARFAPQGGNRQPVRFLIVTDAEKRRQLGEWYLESWRPYVAAGRRGERAPHGTMPDAAKVDRLLAAADHFAEHFGEHPAIVVVLAALSDTLPTDANLGRLSIVGGASVYPMVQNLCLALRGHGVATTLTTLLCMHEPRVKELLGIPDDLATAAFVVAGYPAEPFPTKLSRRAVEKIAFVDSMDRPLSRR